MVVFREIKEEDNEIIAKIIRANLKEKALDIPGTVYFDKNLDCLSDFYLNDENAYYCIFEVDGVVSGGVGLAAFEGIDGAAELQKLYLTNEVDEFAIQMVRAYEEKEFCNVLKETEDLLSDDEKKAIEKENKSNSKGEGHNWKLSIHWFSCSG